MGSTACTDMLLYLTSVVAKIVYPVPPYKFEIVYNLMVNGKEYLNLGKVEEIYTQCLYST